MWVDLIKSQTYDNIQNAMKKICAVTKKGSIIGGGYSNRTRATKFNPTGRVRKYTNLQKKRVFVPELNKTVVIEITTRGMRTMKKNGTYATLLKAGLIKAK
jgi:large subunit ribosomal protein L28